MKMHVEWRVLLPTIGVLAAVALAASYLLNLPLLPTFVLTAAAVFVNGLIATREDDLPVGCNNANGTATPVYASRIASACKWILALALVAFAVAFVAVWFTSGGRADLPFVAGIAIACFFFSLALFVRRRLLLLAGFVSTLGGIAISALVR